MKTILKGRKPTSQPIYIGLIILVILSCSGAKEFDEIPTPIGGDTFVQSVFMQTLGSAYYEVSGTRAAFSIRTNEEGVVESVSLVQATNNQYVNNAVIRAMKDYIKFTPATLNGKRVKAKFMYHFNF